MTKYCKCLKHIVIVGWFKIKLKTHIGNMYNNTDALEISKQPCKNLLNHFWNSKIVGWTKGLRLHRYINIYIYIYINMFMYVRACIHICSLFAVVRYMRANVSNLICLVGSTSQTPPGNEHLNKTYEQPVFVSRWLKRFGLGLKLVTRNPNT